MKLPVICAPMFLISTTRLVNACRSAGIVGTFPSLNTRSEHELDAWLQECSTFDPGYQVPSYGVNLIVHKTNSKLNQHLKLIEKWKVCTG